MTEQRRKNNKDELRKNDTIQVKWVTAMLILFGLQKKRQWELTRFRIGDSVCLWRATEWCAFQWKGLRAFHD